MTLRDYQRDALTHVREHFAGGARSVCLVIPTGGGKTVTASSWLTGDTGVRGVPYLHNDTGLWIVHRIELLRQSAEALSRVLGDLDVGIIAPGHDVRPYARVQVATVQTLLARNQRPAAQRIVWDECHHAISTEWRKLAAAYPEARLLGLTATPERQDGRPLGDIFEALVVAAKYPDLIAAGHLVDCRAYAPPEGHADGLALHPLAAYQRHGEGGQAFVFASNVKAAQDLAAEFTAAGVPAALVSYRSKRGERMSSLEQFARGELRALMSVQALTEGVDIPAARVCILARNFGHVGGYLQAAGRVLRPAPRKTDAILIDLVGAVKEHGLPTAERVYALDGEAIRLATPALRQCPACGFTMPGTPLACPECGHVFERALAPREQMRIYSLDLQRVYSGQQTPTDAKHAEYQRLLELVRSRGWSLAWLVKQYRKLFDEHPPWLLELPPDERRAEFERLRAEGAERGYKAGYPAARYREIFMTWPPWSWKADTMTA